MWSNSDVSRRIIHPGVDGTKPERKASQPQPHFAPSESSTAITFCDSSCWVSGCRLTVYSPSGHRTSSSTSTLEKAKPEPVHLLQAGQGAWVIS